MKNSSTNTKKAKGQSQTHWLYQMTDSNVFMKFDYSVRMLHQMLQKRNKMYGKSVTLTMRLKFGNNIFQYILNKMYQ